MAGESKSSWVITVSSDRPIDDVANDVRAAGFDVRDVLRYTGTITGEGPVDTPTRLRTVRGVVDVSPDYPVHIGPPGAHLS